MRRIVGNLYGPQVCHLPGLDIGRAYRGTEGEFRLGGDIVDVFHYGTGYTSLAVLDISGHGAPAARNAGLVKHALRAYASRGFDARDCVRALNRLCIENSAFEADEEFFATLFFAIIEPSRRTMQYVSAGHDAAFLIARQGVQALRVTGPIIGLTDSDAEFDHSVIGLDAGSIVAAVTDGFSEARNASGVFLGAGAFADIIVRLQACDAERQADEAIRHAYEYSNKLLHDDVAALVVKVL
jgi:serine phosphatase RsbU (regulator of sigma subunit)